MGTNYYLKSKPCESSGHCQTELHIGKSSMGWRFLFRAYINAGMEPSISSFEDWLLELNNPNKVIYDEYHEKIELAEFLELIEDKRNGKSQANLDHYFFQDEKGYDFCHNEFS